MYTFALIAALNSVISLYYYVKIIRAMFLDAPEQTAVRQPIRFQQAWSFVVLLALAVPNVVLGLYWEPLMKVVERAVGFFGGV
jgi:NADH-quinone oxidoreductase subunit N